MTPTDSAWFDTLYRSHASAIYAYFVRRAPRQDCEDLTAEVFATAWRRRADIAASAARAAEQGEAHPGFELAWLYRTASLLLANYRRKTTAVPLGDLPEAIDTTNPELEAIDDLRVCAALATLTPRDRAILFLTAWDGLDPAALADVLGISRGGADAALSRARARLRAAWDAA